MSQILKGITFADTSPDNEVSSARLNDHVDDAILLSGAITEQTLDEAPVAADQAIYSKTASSGALRRATLDKFLPEPQRQGAQLFAATVNFATDQYTLTFSPAPVAIAKGAVIRFVADAANTGATDIVIGDFDYGLFNRAGDELEADDILAGALVTCVFDGAKWQLESAVPLASLKLDRLAALSDTPKTTPVMADRLVLGDSEDSNAATLATLTALWTAIKTASRFTDSNQALATTVTRPHGFFPAVPFDVRVVLVNTGGADNGYATNDEVDVAAFMDSGGEPGFAVSADGTNVVVACRDATTLLCVPKTGGEQAGITEANWKVKIRAWL